MDYIYEAMVRAKESFANFFDKDVGKYDKVFEISDKRCTGHTWNPGFFYINMIRGL